jgi:5-methylcytosine-specific restriction enzyme B
VIRAPQGTNFRVTPEEWDALQELVSSTIPAPPPEGPKVAEPPPSPTPYDSKRITFDELASSTLWDRDSLQSLCDAIEQDSPQLILAGPPGTGKTWVARKVAEYLTQDPGRLFRKVQFHPSYSYEEFMQGLRPVAQASGTIAFQVVDGVVPRMAKEIDTTPGPHILLIDEINRANLPKVLGELMYLFEYRDETIDLQYTPTFSLPPSLRFIGTMNTADRSIRSIDTALRRRFDIVECPPDPAILARYYATRSTEIDLPHLLEGFNTLNGKLADLRDRHHTIGHTFFMRDPMTKPYLERVWRQKIAPLLEEYFFDQPDVAASFTLEQFWPNV